MTRQESRQWYREPFVWLVVGIPGVTVIAGFITLVLAIISYDGLVVDDYYKKGLEINRVIERDRIAQELEIAVDIALSSDHQSVRIYLHGNESFKQPKTLTVNFYHATRSGFDRIYQLKRKEGGMYTVEELGLVPGKWHVEMVSDNWRVIKPVRVSG